MERMSKSQVAKVLLLLSFLSLLLLVPFVSTSLRSSYLYFLLNLLIIVLGVEAGLLASLSKPHVERKPVLGVVCSSSSSTAKEAAGAAIHDQGVVVMAPVGKLPQVEKKKTTTEAAERVQKLKRCRSRPSIFFIGSCDDEEDHNQLQQKEEAVEEEVAVEDQYSAGDLSKQELFMKAEMFIGNFYKQLNMQREESWKKIHGLYHRAF
ncbi:uncharacterized protein M6B38_201900 [Iris pallida]|uniref:Uncharacterized protein n=1 Tax=Iris pallida TaxID=29817 RepID=A0AAX6EA25_IRIPA|nr:uncharacterized protein M6B38_201900 [Iris pallida]